MRTALLAAAAAAALASAAQADTVMVTADRMIDVESGRVVNRPWIVIRDGRIVTVGDERRAIPAMPLDRRVDLPGMTLLPGLIDMHVHLDGSPLYGGYTGLQFSDRFWSAIAVTHARRTLDAGFTTVRNVGSEHWNDVGLRQAIEEGHVVGPRVVSAGYSFGSTGGHCDSTYFPPSMQQRAPYNIDSADDARRSVREVRKYGAQVIKICATGGVFSRNTEPGAQQLSLDEMKAVVAEAHMQGLKVAAHAHGATGIKDAIRAGVDTIEHASLIDDEGIQLAKRHGAWLAMDIYNTDYTQAEGKKNGVLEDNLRKDRDIAETQRQGFAKAHRAGVKHVFATDAAVYPHGDNAKQFAVMVRYGMTPLQAIQTATVNAAEALGSHGRDVGVIEAGRWGDLIAVRGDPLADVRALETTPVVIKSGVVVKDAR
ncbi:MAG TPA: amidohydrolase family protein [Caulobacteraceae bacterium]|jgi:imidazolonepropionase-like amidohydrolase